MPERHNRTATFVSSFVVFDRRFSLLSTRDTGAYPFVFQRFSEPVSVIATISEQPFDVWQAAEQCPCADIIADLPGGDFYGGQEGSEKVTGRSHLKSNMEFFKVYRSKSYYGAYTKNCILKRKGF